MLVKFRAIISLLALLFSMCGAQTQSTQTEVQTESQSTGTTDAAADTTQLDVSAELSKLRDMAAEQATILEELRVTQTLFQDVLQSTKSQLYKVESETNDQQTDLAAMKERLVVSETKVEALERLNAAQETKVTELNTEVAVLKTRLAASEAEVVNLRKVTALQTADLRSVSERLVATETDMEHVKTDTAAQHTDLTTMRTDIMNLKMDTAAQETRLSASETEQQDLREENAAQEAALAAVKTRLSATESEVVNLEKEITEQPKVAFSAALIGVGFIDSGNSMLVVVFPKIITNVGQAYNNTTGSFTAPVKGVYYFRFTVNGRPESNWMNIEMFKNEERVMHLSEYETDELHHYLSSGVTLQLEVKDKVNLRLPPSYRLWEDNNNRNIFSGFLLFPL